MFGWKLLALTAGWAGVRDGKTGQPLVYRDYVHYHGPDAWRWAGRHSLADVAAAAAELLVIAVFVVAIIVAAAAIAGRLS